MRPQPPQCVLCPSKGTGRSFVPFEGPADSPLLIVGQGPGEDEAYTGSCFVGKSGAMLNKWLQLAGIDRRMARVGNTVLCWMPEDPGALKGNRAPKAAEAAYCREQHWGGREELGRRVIVAVGVPAMKQFYGPRAGEGTAGQLAKWVGGGGMEVAENSDHGVRTPENALEMPLYRGFGPLKSQSSKGNPTTYLLGLIHPSAIMRGKWGQEGLQIATLKRVRRILDGWEPEIPDFTKPPPNSNLFPSLAEMKAWEASLGPDEAVAIDIEAAGKVIRLIGLVGCDSLSYVGVHFRRQGGSTWVHCPLCQGRENTEVCSHPRDDTAGVVEWLWDFLRSGRPCIFQNGASYDIVEQLEEVGFEVGNYAFDTLLAMHIAMPEARKSLEHISLATTGISGWKKYLREGGGHLK